VGKADELLAGSTAGFDDGRLEPGLAATLDRQLQDALDHPLRREILRTLSAESGARSIGEIRSALASFRASELNYHVVVLLRTGAIALDGERPVLGGRQRFYTSEVAGKSQVESVLRATEKEDKGRRRAVAGGRSARFLTMFRIPRPTRTIRLGDR
jgi:DNA-binding transcriptional ArsR family regulator